MSSPHKRPFKANLKTFTDRIAFKKLLADAVESPQSYDEYRVKVIYGLGGQGKSYLKNNFFVKEYLSNLIVTDKNLIYCDGTDFERIETTRSAEKALLCIAKELIEKGGIPLPAFSLAFLKLKQLTSLSGNLEEQYPYLFKIRQLRINGGGAVDEVLQEIVDFAIGSGLPEAAASIPLIGYFAKKLASKGKNKVIQWLRESEAGEILQDLDDLDKYELLNNLPRYLGWDVYQALKASSVDGIPKKRIVIIIDGYETLWDGERNRNLGKDLWVRQLVEYMTGVLFVIFGREALRWHEIEKNEDMLQGIQQIPIDGFDDEDADDYLLRVPIEEKDVRLAIIENAKGSDPNGKCFPLYLQLEAKTYENIRNTLRTPIAADFANGNEKTETEIVTRLFKHMNENVSNALEALSLCNYIDDEIIQLMEKESAFAPASVSVKTLCEYSFIVHENGKMLIHGFVREVAADQYEKKHGRRYLAIHEALFSYFDNKLQFEGYRKLDMELETTVGYAAVHKKKFDPAGFPDWILSKSKALYGASMLLDDVLKNQLHEAVDYLIPGHTIEYDSYSPEQKLLLGQLFHQLAERYEAAVNKKEALRFIGLATNTFARLFPENVLAARRARHANKELLRDELLAIDLYKLALEKAAEISVNLDLNISAGEYFNRARRISNDFELEFNENEFMKYLGSIGRYSEAEAFFFRRFEHSRATAETLKRKGESYPNQLTAALYEAMNAASDLARILRAQGRYEEAIRYGEACLKLTMEAAGPDHLYTAFARHNLARTFVKDGQHHEQANRLLDEVKEVYDATYSQNHLYIGQLKADFFELNRHTPSDEAMQLFAEANRILSNQVLINRRSIEITILAYELCLKAASRGMEGADKALPFVEGVITSLFYSKNKFEEMKNLFNVFNPFFHKVMRTVADIHSRKGEISRADELTRIATEFERLSNYFSLVRIANENPAELDGDDKLLAFQLFRGVMSLPSDPSSIVIHRSRLPFYKTVDLFTISFPALEIPTLRYVLSDMKSASVIDHTNGPIYALGETDLSLTPEHAMAYATFFFDTTMGRHGHFHLLRDGRDIPWEVDKDIADDYKESIAALLTPLHFVAEDEDAYRLRGTIIFKNSVFLTTILIKKENGRVVMPDDSPVEFYQMVDGSIALFDANNPPVGDFNRFNTIPASVDPIYENAPVNEHPDNLYGRILRIFDIMEEDLHFIHRLGERQGEEMAEFEYFQQGVKAMRGPLEAEKTINLKAFERLVIFNYNANVAAYNYYIEMGDASDSFAEKMREKMKFMDTVLDEVKEFKERQRQN